MPRQQWKKELPARRVRKYDWPTITEQLRSRPGEWLLVDEKASTGLQSAINLKKMVALRSDEWDYETRTFNNNKTTRTCELWMRAVPREG